MSLACNTPEGRKFIERQNVILQRFANKYQLGLLITRSDSDCPVDGLYYRGLEVRAVATVNARALSFGEFRRFGNLVMKFDVLCKAYAIAKDLRCSYVQICGLESGEVFYWRICDQEQRFVSELSVRMWQNKKDCNSEKHIEKATVLLPFRSAIRLDGLESKHAVRSSPAD